MRSCSQRPRGRARTPQASRRPRAACSTIRARKESLDEFVSQWLRFDRILTASKDRRSFPQFTRETAVAMTEEARRFIGDLVWNDRNFMDLFTADYGFMNADLAAIYGVHRAGEGFRPCAVPGRTPSAPGCSGRRLFLALTAKPDDSSPTARGLFVREQFLCQHVPEPPPGVNTNLPPVTEAKPQTNRDRMSEHATNPSCATCHNLIDPIGFGLEKFDAIGAQAREVQASVSPAERGEGGRQRQRRRRSSSTSTPRLRRRDSGFEVLVAVGTGRGAGEERRNARSAS